MSNTDNDYHYSEEEQQHHNEHYSEEEHHQDSGEDFNDQEEQHLYEEDYSEYQQGLDLRKATKRVEVMNVFCTCRMPEEDGERMISCDLCKQWFHEKCITVPEEAWTDASYLWYRTDCQ